MCDLREEKPMLHCLFCGVIVVRGYNANLITKDLKIVGYECADCVKAKRSKDMGWPNV